MRHVRFLCLAVAVLVPAVVFAADNPRVFITQSHSWEVGSGGAAVDGTFGSSGGGGERPQTAEIIKTFRERCPNAIVTIKQDTADFIVQLDHEGGKGISRDNKIVVFDAKSGDAVFSRSTRSLGNAVKDACPVIYREFSKRAAAATRQGNTEATVEPVTANQFATENLPATIHVRSNPDGADVEIDGKFVGNAPSTLQLTPGDHTIVVSKNGYTTWRKKVHIVPGDVNIVAELFQSH